MPDIEDAEFVDLPNEPTIELTNENAQHPDQHPGEPEAPELQGVPHMSQQDLEITAFRIVRNAVFWSEQIKEEEREDMTPIVFSPIGYNMTAGYDQEQIGAYFADMSQAAPAKVNGYPYFRTASLLHKDQVKEMRKLIAQLQKAFK